MPFGLSDQDYELIKSVFRPYNQIEEVIVFGSRAMGTDKPGSDIDLALKGVSIELEDILHLQNQLQELPLAYEYDVIDYDSINNPALVEHIDKYGLVFYRKEKMPNHWKIYQLEELVEIKSGLTIRSYQKSSVNGLPLVTNQQLSGNRILHENLSYVTSSVNCLEEFFLLEGDIVISRNIGINRKAYVSKREEGWLFSNSCLRVRPISNQIDSRYLFYLLIFEDFRKKMQASAIGSTMLNIDVSSMGKIEVVIPELKSQQSIGTFLSVFDEKIELNLEIIKTLEALTQVTFTDWFIHFNFPGFDGQLIGGVPKGWKVGSILEIADRKVVNKIIFESKIPNDNAFLSLFVKNVVKQYFCGMIVSAVPLQILEKIDVILPSFDVMNEFEKIVKPLNEKQQLLMQENQTLSQIREYLLPRLLTGKIQLEE